MRLTWIFAFSAVLATAPAGPEGGCAEPRRKSSPVVVEGQRLMFDPKTCTEGRGMFFWALGSVRVTVLGHKDNHCVFDYEWEVEGAGTYQVHRIKVPAGSGPVVIDAEGRKGKEEHHWSHVFTSFTKKQATLIRRAGLVWIEDLVEGTGQFVAYHTTRRREPHKPAAVGEKVALRFTVYAGEDFKQRAQRARQGQVVTLKVGSGEDWKWARAASAEMAPGEVRRVRLPARIAGAAKSWLPGVKDDATLFLEMELTPAGRN
jgi:hypothetical protein